MKRMALTWRLFVLVFVLLSCFVYFDKHKKHRGDRALNDKLHANTYRMAARDNATSFPSPLHQILAQLHDSESMEELGTGLSPPRTGQSLTHVVFILFETKHLKHTIMKRRQQA